MGILWAEISGNCDSASWSRSVCRRRSAAWCKRSCLICPAGLAGVDSFWWCIRGCVALLRRTLRALRFLRACRFHVRISRHPATDRLDAKKRLVKAISPENCHELDSRPFVSPPGSRGWQTRTTRPRLPCTTGVGSCAEVFPDRGLAACRDSASGRLFHSGRAAAAARVEAEHALLRFGCVHLQLRSSPSPTRTRLRRIRRSAKRRL